MHIQTLLRNVIYYLIFIYSLDFFYKANESEFNFFCNLLAAVRFNVQKKSLEHQYESMRNICKIMNYFIWCTYIYVYIYFDFLKFSVILIQLHLYRYLRVEHHDNLSCLLGSMLIRLYNVGS